MHTEIREINAQDKAENRKELEKISQTERMFLVSESNQADCCDLYKLNPAFLLLWSSVNTASLVKIIHGIQMGDRDKEPVFPNPLLHPFSILICRPSPTTCIQQGQL